MPNQNDDLVSPLKPSLDPLPPITPPQPPPPTPPSPPAGTILVNTPPPYLPPIETPPITSDAQANTPPQPPSEPHIQKSPFRFLIPILGIGILILILIFGIQKFVQSRSSSPSTSTGSQTAAKTTTITYWGLWESSVIMQEVLARFEAQNPNIKVSYQQQSIKDYRERLQNALKGGTGPDIFRFHMTWTPLFASDLEPIPSTILSGKDFETQQYPIAQTWLKSSKGYMGIPLMYEGLGLYYNQSIFDAAGKNPPKTWEELRRLAVELTVKNKQGEIQRAGIALGTTSNVDNWSDILGLLLLQNAANPARPNNALGQDALTFYTLFNTTDKVWDETLPSSTVAFASEKVAMIIAPSWRALEVKNMNPNIKFGIAPVPQLPDTKINWASFWVEGVSSTSDKTKQAAAWKLLSFLNQKDTLRDLYAAASKERLFGEVFARTDMTDQLTTDPYVGNFVSGAPYAKTWYLCSRTFDNGPNDKISKYYEDAVNAVNQGESPAKALQTVEQGVGQIISQYRLPAH